MKVHGKYDYECMNNSLSTYPLLSQYGVVSNQLAMASSRKETTHVLIDTIS